MAIALNAAENLFRYHSSDFDLVYLLLNFRDHDHHLAGLLNWLQLHNRFFAAINRELLWRFYAVENTFGRLLEN